ncbi:hypothetical protein BCR33DRAFT_718189 [Rhizoclosmatium globosum]|uniref:SET domain-containing protein n=1 Tax=Rhizoclosmatium globosum TaxID=329046 RepID=A0A1Y2C856_9FUNG|nr:hypothetical protein BCR33DRAFT_718189 [Rhizoclosmatium globosum]|eukprot:ORY42495.1 hypothetical protein BCR33DRAFT_718189 [Rhizoclosmatium globosum]
MFVPPGNGEACKQGCCLNGYFKDASGLWIPVAALKDSTDESRPGWITKAGWARLQGAFLRKHTVVLCQGCEREISGKGSNLCVMCAREKRGDQWSTKYRELIKYLRTIRHFTSEAPSAELIKKLKGYDPCVVEGCENSCGFTYPLCHYCSIAKYGVYVFTSTIIGAGLGLFAGQDFQKNQFVKGLFYTGRIVEASESLSDKQYVMDVGLDDSHSIQVDGETATYGSLLRFVNVAVTREQLNCRFMKTRGSNNPQRNVRLKVTEDINAGHEFLGYYQSNKKTNEAVLWSSGQGTCFIMEAHLEEAYERGIEKVRSSARLQGVSVATRKKKRPRAQQESGSEFEQ